MKKLVDWLIKRRKKQLHIPIVIGNASLICQKKSGIK